MDAALPALLEVFFRALGLLLALPFGFDVVSVFVRISLAALIASCGYELALPGAEPSVLLILGNVLLGFLLGIPAALVFHGAEWFGEFFDVARGQTVGSIINPFHESSTVTARLCSSALWAWLLFTGLLCELITAFGESFSIVRELGLGLSVLPAVGARLFSFLCSYLGGMAGSVLPFLIVFVGIEVAFGFLSKLLPGARFSGETFGIKLVLGFVVLAALADQEFFLGLFGAAKSVPVLLEPR